MSIGEIISAFIAGCALLLSATALLRSKNNDSTSSGERIGKIDTKIEHIEGDVREIKESQEKHWGILDRRHAESIAIETKNSTMIEQVSEWVKAINTGMAKAYRGSK